MSDQNTYGGFTDQSVTIEVRGGSVPGPRHLILPLEPGDDAAPEYTAFRAWFQRRMHEQIAAATGRPASLTPI